MSALMTNWDIAEDTMKQAQGSEGSAEKELENYKKGIQYHLDVLKAQFQEFSNTALNADAFIGLIDGGTTFLSLLTQIIDKLGILTPLLAGVGIAKFAKNFD